MNYPKVGIIILTYNAADFITPCIKSIQKNTYPNKQILIVDNDSKDNTVKIIKKQFPEIKIIQTGKDLGYAGGNNVGIKHFQKQNCKYILLINPDTRADKTLVTQLIQTAEKNSTIGTIGPIITYTDYPKKIWFAGGYFNQTFCYTRHPHMNQIITQQEVTSSSTDFITGACLMIRTTILSQTGLLPDKYFLYFEDSFFCQTVKAHGYTNYLLAQPLVQHAVSATTGKIGQNTMTPLRAYYFARNPLWYIRTEKKGRQKLTNFLGQFLIRLPYYSLQILKDQNPQAAKAYLKGIKDGLYASIPHK